MAVRSAAELLERLRQRVGLADRAGEAVQQEAVPSLGAVDPFHHHPADEVVGHEVAPVHVGLGLFAEVAPLLDRSAQDVAGGVVGQPEVRDEPLGLGALAGAGWAEQDEVQLRHLRGKATWRRQSTVDSRQGRASSP